MEDFIREQIKEKPLNKKRILIRLGVSAACGLVFAIVACAVFVAFFMMKDRRDQGGKNIGTEIGSETQTQTETSYLDDTETETKPSEVIETETGTTESTEIHEVVKEFSIDDYQKMQNQLYDIGTEVNRSVVAVTSFKSDADWFNNTYESVGTSAGVIMAIHDDLVFVLAETKATKGSKAIKVTFESGEMVDADVWQIDGNSGIVMLAVKRSGISQETMDSIEEIKLANSRLVSKGLVTIALGSPLGTNFSILLGTVTSTDNDVSAFDRNFSILTTDIIGSSKGSGILINTKGQLIGLIKQNYSGADRNNTITAIGITELKSIIDMLIAGKPVPYFGTKVMTVTDKIAEEYDLPTGIYVREIMVDSPAMNAGIQSGDVITKINGKAVLNEYSYYNTILALDLEKKCTVTFLRQGAAGYVEFEADVIPGVLK